MLTHFSTHTLLWLIAAVLAGIASGVGILYPALYTSVMPAAVLPAALPQDVTTLVAALVLLACALWAKERDVVPSVIAISILGYLFYEYGILAIERIYTVLYFLYLAIFSLSFYAAVAGIAMIRPAVLRAVRVPNRLRIVAIAFSLLVPAIFIPLWISSLIPLIQRAARIDYLYSIYILDLCFVMPAFLILAVLSMRKHGLGLLLTPALFIKSFTILFPLAGAELMKPYYQQTLSMTGFWSSLVLSLVFLVLAVVYLRGMRVEAAAT